MANFFQARYLPTPTPQKQHILLLFTTYSLLTAQPSFDILPYLEPVKLKYIQSLKHKFCISICLVEA